MPSNETPEQTEEINAGNHVFSVGIVLRTTISDWRKIERFITTQSSGRVVCVHRSDGLLWIVPV